MTYTVSSGTVGTLNSIIPYHTCGATLYQKVEIFAILGPRLHPWHRLHGATFCTAKRTHVPLGFAEFHVNRCNESPLLGENADFRPVSKFKYRLTPLRGILPVNYPRFWGLSGSYILYAELPSRKPINPSRKRNIKCCNKFSDIRMFKNFKNLTQIYLSSYVITVTVLINKQRRFVREINQSMAENT